MYVTLVDIHVKPEYLDAFRTATLDNARNSIQETGSARFDVIKQQDDPTHWILVEVYRDPTDQLRHRETAHYARWRDTVAEMMAEPRIGIRYDPVYPDEDQWG